MKRSELREIVREALQGHSKYTGKTQGGTSADFMKILTAIAKGEPTQVEKGNAVLDKANPDNVAKILNGEKPVYEADKTELTQDPETKEFTRRMKLTPKDKETTGKVQDMMAKERGLKEEEELQNYLVHYRVGEDDEDDVQVKATSPEEAIEKARAGKTAGGQSMPRLARSFSAKLYNN